jgi:hypothetical protein
MGPRKLANVSCYRIAVFIINSKVFLVIIAIRLMNDRTDDRLLEWSWSTAIILTIDRPEMIYRLWRSLENSPIIIHFCADY